MKFLVLFLALLSPVAFAAEPEVYDCKEVKDAVGPADYRMVLRRLGPTERKEGVKTPYQFDLYQGEVLLVSEKVIGFSEDVIFDFGSKAKKISGRIYLDELEETSVTWKGKEIRFDCN